MRNKIFSEIWEEIKKTSKNFFLEEILEKPFLNCSEGKNTLIKLKIENFEHFSLIKLFSNFFNLNQSKISYGGIKDKKIIKIQTFIFLNIRLEKKKIIELQEKNKNLKILTFYYTNEIWKKKIFFNYFKVKISKKINFLEKKLKKISKNSFFFNFYGIQKFGKKGKNFILGKKIIEKKNNFNINLILKKFLINSFQSYLFNKFLLKKKNLKNFMNFFFCLKKKYSLNYNRIGKINENNLKRIKSLFILDKVEIIFPLFGYENYEIYNYFLKNEISNRIFFHNSIKFLNLKGGYRKVFFKIKDFSFIKKKNIILIKVTLEKGNYFSILIYNLINSYFL